MAMSNEIASPGGADEAVGDGARDCAPRLVNPSTGLANDYLNVFSEILLLLEFLPAMPEMTDDALAWRPRGYCEYFEQSPLPGARDALRAYDRIDPNLRARFESILTRLTDIAVKAQRRVAAESSSPNYPDSIVDSCEKTTAAMRAGLARVASLINEGVKPRAAGPKPVPFHKAGH
jgi:hypothetical protein